MKSCRPLLGTYVVIWAEHDDETVAAAAIASAFAAMEKVQQLMSVFDPDSDLSCLNAMAHRGAMAVHPWTAEVITLAKTVHQASGGLFDCGVAPHLAAWGMLPETAALAAPATSSLENVQVDDQGWVRYHAPTRLDLGGIAKGFAVDKAAEALLDAGVSHGLINAGGDLRVLGEVEEPIHVRSAKDPRQLHYAGSLQDGAFATSGCYYSRRERAEGEVSALVNPHSRQALLSERSYSIIAPTCAVADALTKVLALSGDPAHPSFSQFSAHPLIV